MDRIRDRVLRYLCMLACLLLFSCSSLTEEKRLSQIAKVNLGSDPQTLDPRKARDHVSTTLVKLLFEGLTHTSKTGETELSLAESVEISEDKTHYVFHLRKTFWSNGDLLTAFDFAESWKTILDPHFASDIAHHLFVVKNARKAKLGEIGMDHVGIHALNQNTLHVELEAPTPFFLEMLAMSCFAPVPVKVATANPLWVQKDVDFVGNGPFVLSKWRSAERIELKKNSRYFKAKSVALKGLEFFMVDPDVELRMFEEGLLDWMGSPLSFIPISALEEFKRQNTLKSAPCLATYFYRLNTEKQYKDKKNPLCSQNFRKALFFALDREKLVEHLLQGGELAAFSLVPFLNGGVEKEGAFDLEKARGFLSDALLELDLTKQTLAPIKISYASQGRSATLAQAVQQQWEKGLDLVVELEAVEPAVFFQRLSHKQYQLAAGSWCADFSDPINFLNLFKYASLQTNATGWENIKYIDLLNQSEVLNGDERRAVLREAEQILMEQMPICPVFHYALNYIQSEKLFGVVLSPLGHIDFRTARMEE